MSSILDHPIISQRYFFPEQRPLAGAFMVETGGIRLACYLHAPRPAAWTIVHFHGNGELVADYLGTGGELLRSLGLNILFAEYRGYGGSSGQPALGTMLDDVPAIIGALDTDPSRLVLFGRSVGSIYALRGAACFPDVAGLIIESGVAAPLERILMRASPEEMGTTIAELRQATAAELNHERILRNGRFPLLVLHSRYDNVVDCENATRLYRWAAGPKRLRVFEEGDHHDIMAVNAAEYRAEIERFLAGLESRAAPGR